MSTVAAAMLVAGVGVVVVLGSTQAGAVVVSNETQFRLAWTTAATPIDLTSNITLHCTTGAGDGVSVVNSATPIVVNGHGRTITQTCATGTNNGVLEQQGTGLVTLQNVTITGGHAASSGGGGILTQGSVSLTSSTVSGNTVTNGGGGGIFAYGGVSLTNSSVSANTGSGIGAGPGGVSLTSSTVSANVGRGMATSGNVSLRNSTVSGNSTGGSGGGIVGGGNSFSVSLTNSTVSGNTAGFNGGGILVNSQALVSLTNSTVSGNTAGNAGGIIAHHVSLIYSTVAGNTAQIAANINTGYGGAPGTLTSFGSVVAVPLGGGANCVGAATSSGYNWDDGASCGFSLSTDHSNAGAPALGALANNTGPTKTRLPQPGSGLINAIPAGACQSGGASGITLDQRALARPFPAGGACDIGAVEVQPKPTLDHFKCYVPKPIAKEVVPVKLKDQFSGDVFQPINVGKLSRFCNPVKKAFAGTVTPIQKPELHLSFYEADGPWPDKHSVSVQNQFGLQDLVIGPIKWLAVPTSLNSPALPNPARLNHFECYPVLSFGAAPIATVTLTDLWHVEPNVVVGDPIMFCNPVVKVHKTNTFPIVDPGSHLTCYRVNQPPFHKPVKIRNQFTSSKITIIGARMLCVPSRKLQFTTIAPTPPSTTTTTATTTTTNPVTPKLATTTTTPASTTTTTTQRGP